MQITLMQGIMLAIAAIIIGVDYWLEAFFIFRPLVVSTVTGIILGNVPLGLATGALTELAFAGLTPAGGTQPPNPVLAGFMSTTIAYTAGVTPEVALGLCLPFSFLMQYVILFFYSSFSFFMAGADKAAEQADVNKIIRTNIITTAIVAISYGVIVFSCTYLAQEPMAKLVTSMPAWLIHGLEVAGGILPAIGFGMLLRVMMKAKYIPFFIAGFLMMNFIPMNNLLPVALLGTAFALFDFFNAKARKEEIAAAVANNQGNEGGNKHVGI
ncbi:PTS galactosamine transporter subunit IIC [Anaerorhabdus sp.]|jgi:galactosamine PTS system EIIC component|uniref:PTS galactosamine transporter subunit IIC n=3 Tax=Anaerorhabdus sp. TaxID=1872524 RepID=UPI002B1FC7C8|nr:PTS galactosamine transporter subunit IIC [Anaerorhabdus sp.]MEA4875434.1 PTS galactosamine transporter subunit IIC [Anaerorhabdus sp.]